jgi:hypothetical protein
MAKHHRYLLKDIGMHGDRQQQSCHRPPDINTSSDTKEIACMMTHTGDRGVSVSNGYG